MELVFSWLPAVFFLTIFTEHGTGLDQTFYRIGIYGGAVTTILHCAISAIVLPVFGAPVKALDTLLQSDVGKQSDQEVRAMRRIAAQEYTTFLINVITLGVEFILLLGVAVFGTKVGLLFMFYYLSAAADSVTNIALVLVLSGFFVRDHGERKSETVRLAKYRASCKTLELCTDAKWQEAVRDLAYRGFTLEQLLAFYKRLPVVMPHFAPDVHTTADVARQAIIPETADERCAMAVKMMGGVPTVPHTMVTHAWSNLFRDLVASIFADALHQQCFSWIAFLLDTDLTTLEKMLDSAALAKTYWVCVCSLSTSTLQFDLVSYPMNEIH